MLKIPLPMPTSESSDFLTRPMIWSASDKRPALRFTRMALVAVLALGLELRYLFSNLWGKLARKPGGIVARADDECQSFQETGYKVCGRFLQYWRDNGGLTQQGLPISEVFEEKKRCPTRRGRPASQGAVFSEGQV